ncbi:hypothetical protein BC835DRAFT_1412192 [Cytidiella melzeri]|nr:hypothetical protein BC835DRAFT_1412192 [Cytidiella melzeri]
MPRAKAALDPSPVELPKHKPEPLKRSRSTASLASLPTPPPTRKRKRSRSRHSRATDSDSELDLQDSDHAELDGARKIGKDVVVAENNRRKLLRVDAIAAELSGQAAEDAFWMGESTVTTIESLRSKGKAVSEETKAKESTGVRTRSQSRSPSSSPVQMLKRTRTGLLSPPKSHRRRSPRKTAFPSLPTIAEDPSTPQPKNALSGVAKRLFPERDSPNNPFLVSEESTGVFTGSQDSTSGAGASKTHVPRASKAHAPRTPKKHIERPTLTYVFRGVRQEFENPLYDPRYPETGVAPDGGPDSPSNLPPQDPNFSPKEYCPPTVLFREARTQSKRRAEVESDDEHVVEASTRAKGKLTGKKSRTQPEHKRQKSEWDTSDEEEELNFPSTPKAKTPVTPGRGRAATAAFAAAKPLSHRRTTAKVTEVVVEAPRTRSRTRIGSASVAPAIPQKDRSDPARRAFGPRGRAK